MRRQVPVRVPFGPTVERFPGATALDSCYTLWTGGLDFCSRRWISLGLLLFLWMIVWALASRPMDSCCIE
jgi:hypothetical protein